MTYNHITSISSLPFLFWQRFLNWLGLAVVIEIVVIALLFVVGFLVSGHFRTTGNVADIFEQMTGLAFVALGQTVVIITGGIDLCSTQPSRSHRLCFLALLTGERIWRHR